MFTEQLSCYSVPLVFMLLFLYQLRFQSGKTAPQIESRPAVEDLLGCRGVTITSGRKYQHIRPVLVEV